MAIPLLSPFYADELLYSMLGRIHWMNGSSSPKQTLGELFSSRSVRAGVFLQTSLGRLAANLPPKRGLTAERLAQDTTLFPYLTAFQPAEIRRWALETMTDGDATSLHVRLGLAAGKVRLPSALRYCPACRKEMLARQGELYWKRTHQLPGVLVCIQHGGPLADSMVRLAECGQHDFIVADEANCPADPNPPSWAAKPEVLKQLGDIARASSALLINPPEPQPLAFWGRYYRASLTARGLGKGTYRLNQSALREAFLARFGLLVDILPHAAPDGWLGAMGRTHRKAIAPLHHLLLRQLLAVLPMEKALPQPFGSGPWPCRNHLAAHFGQPVIRECQTHQEGGKTIGVFRCACGYAFSQAAGVGSRPRILDLGPRFGSRLKELVSCEISLRGTAKALHVDPKTVLRYAAKFGVVTPWKLVAERQGPPPKDGDSIHARWVETQRQAPMTRKELRQRLPTEFAWLYRHDREWLEVQPPYPKAQSKPTPRRDWLAQDAATGTALQCSAAQLREETPPTRITRAALERGMGPTGWLGKRLKQLPRSTELLTQLTEQLDAFRCRRIKWAAEELARQGLPVLAWRLRRLGGLPDTCTPPVETALRAAEETTG
jgi:hypothetical protein